SYGSYRTWDGRDFKVGGRTLIARWSIPERTRWALRRDQTSLLPLVHGKEVLDVVDLPPITRLAELDEEAVLPFVEAHEHVNERRGDGAGVDLLVFRSNAVPAHRLNPAVHRGALELLPARRERRLAEMGVELVAEERV